MQSSIPFKLDYSKQTPSQAVAEFLAEAARLIENQAVVIERSNRGSATSLEMAKAGREVAAILRGIVIEVKKAP